MLGYARASRTSRRHRHECTRVRVMRAAVDYATHDSCFYADAASPMICHVTCCLMFYAFHAYALRAAATRERSVLPCH